MTYSLKFRQQVLSIKAKEGLTYGEAAQRFGIGLATLMRWTKRLEPCATRNKPATKIDADALRRDVAQYPDAYQFERAQRLGVNANGIRKALQRLHFTRKKSRCITPKPMTSDASASKKK